MSGQQPCGGDKMPTLPPDATRDSELNQSYLPYLVRPSSQSTNQAPAGYNGANNMPLSPMSTTSPSQSATYSSMPTTLPSLSSLLNPGPPSAIPSMYPPFNDWARDLGLTGPSGLGNDGYQHYHQHITPGFLGFPPNQLPSHQRIEPKPSSTTALNFPTTQPPPMPTMNDETSLANPSTTLPGVTFPERPTENVAGHGTPTGDNIDVAMSSEIHSDDDDDSLDKFVSRAPPRRYRGRSKPTGLTGAGVEKVRWKAGLKEKKITDDMSEGEREEAKRWNKIFAEAKGDHNRAQNRESARRSRARKQKELDDTRARVAELRAQNGVMLQQNENLRQEIATARQENAQMRAIIQQQMGVNTSLNMQHQGLRDNFNQQFQAHQILDPRLMFGQHQNPNQAQLAPQTSSSNQPGHSTQQEQQPGGNAHEGENENMLSFLNSDSTPSRPTWSSPGNRRQ
ncbi:hypothetical protein F4677DRAFT_445496 [Hypoxylon crocopeplum]|nr:hypothetical protein F4677DRAFT_445496 [Hypoxylon crocopeplum]